MFGSKGYVTSGPKYNAIVATIRAAVKNTAAGSHINGKM
jgi:hypothetical protein